MVLFLWKMTVIFQNKDVEAYRPPVPVESALQDKANVFEDSLVSRYSGKRGVECLRHTKRPEGERGRTPQLQARMTE